MERIVELGAARWRVRMEKERRPPERTPWIQSSSTVDYFFFLVSVLYVVATVAEKPARICLTSPA